MILKILLLIAVITTVYFIFFKKKPNKIDSSEKQSRDQKPKANDMLECESCGVFCEINDMILSNGKYYCSQECVDKG